VTADGRYLVIGIYKGTYQENRVSLIDLQAERRDVVHLIEEFDAAYAFLGSEGSRLFFLTTSDAPLGRIVVIDLESPDCPSWTELIPESQGRMEQAVYVGGRFVVSTLFDATARLTVHDGTGRLLHEAKLPGAGSVPLLEGREKGETAYFSYGDFLHPNVIFAHDVSTGETRPFREIRLPYDRAAYETETHWIETAKGVKVPVFLTRKRGVDPGPETPTCLYGYGGFNIAMSPHFKIDHLSWLDLGGQLAVACLRGGGEFGRDWHLAGAKENRPNVFADFIAVAEWLVETKRTSIPRLAIYGRSNGGLLVGACMTKRPDLFGVCLPTVGVLDMLRFHLFTVGSFWVSDYGSPEDPAMFPVLQAYSPMHNVVPGTAYPPTLVTTADHDDRVFPAHSHKFAATLQAAQAVDAPILLRVDVRAGHGLGKPKGKLLDEVADRWAFAFAALGAEPTL
jgi:prolyl oligopeptidase